MPAALAEIAAGRAGVARRRSSARTIARARALLLTRWVRRWNRWTAAPARSPRPRRCATWRCSTRSSRTGRRHRGGRATRGRAVPPAGRRRRGGVPSRGAGSRSRAARLAAAFRPRRRRDEPAGPCRLRGPRRSTVARRAGRQAGVLHVGARRSRPSAPPEARRACRHSRRVRGAQGPRPRGGGSRGARAPERHSRGGGSTMPSSWPSPSSGSAAVSGPRPPPIGSAWAPPSCPSGWRRPPPCFGWPRRTAASEPRGDARAGPHDRRGAAGAGRHLPLSLPARLPWRVRRHRLRAPRRWARGDAADAHAGARRGVAPRARSVGHRLTVVAVGDSTRSVPPTNWRRCSADWRGTAPRRRPRSRGGRSPRRSSGWSSWGRRSRRSRCSFRGRRVAILPSRRGGLGRGGERARRPALRRAPGAALARVHRAGDSPGSGCGPGRWAPTSPRRPSGRRRRATRCWQELARFAARAGDARRSCAALSATWRGRRRSSARAPATWRRKSSRRG